MADDADAIEEALERLLDTEKRWIKQVLPIESGGDVASSEVDMQAVRDVIEIRDCADYLAMLIVDAQTDRGKPESIYALNLLMLKCWLLGNQSGSSSFDQGQYDEIKAKLAHARSFIDRRPASFYTEIVEAAYNDFVASNGPWTDKASKLAGKLKPEIDRRAKAGGGEALAPDTITRRLKKLMPTQH